MNYTTAKPLDKTDISDLIIREIREFPGLNADKIESQLMDLIKRGDVIVAKDKKDIVGALIYHRSTGELVFMAVEPSHRGQHVAQEMFRYMTSMVPEDREIFTYSYRTDDDSSTGAEKFFTERLGFKPRAYEERDGRPVQKFIYKR